MDPLGLKVCFTERGILSVVSGNLRAHWRVCSRGPADEQQTWRQVYDTDAIN